MPHAHARHTVPDRPAFADLNDPDWGGRRWPASWITGPTDTPGPRDTWYRLVFALAERATLRIYVSGDQRYDLALDGQRVGRGPHRGDLNGWCFEAFDLDLPAGPHAFVALVSSPGAKDDLSPTAQLAMEHGFLLAAEGPLAETLSTGAAPWRARSVTGVTHLKPELSEARLAGGTQRFDAGAMHWPDDAKDPDAGWVAADTRGPAQQEGAPYGELGRIRPLVPSPLPAMMERPFRAGVVRGVAEHAAAAFRAVDAAHADAAAWRGLLQDDTPVRIPAGQTRCVLIDLEDYFCVFPSLTLDGGRDAEVRVGWAEALFDEPHQHATKAHRDAVDGRFFVGRGDRFVADGHRRTFEPFGWRAGRYVRVTVTTQDAPLTIATLHWSETRYPLDTVPLPDVDDPRLARALPVLERGLLMCMHESYMDTPYYEQLMYAGDTRLEALCTYVRSADDRLPMRAIELFGGSTRPGGLTQARYPSAMPQVIPSFALVWVAMLHDLAWWRGQAAFVASFMPTARSVLEAFRQNLGDDGLFRALPGWNFLDWVPSWAFGVPPGGRDGVNGASNWQLVDALRRKAELEDWLNEPRLAERDRATSQRLADALRRPLWDAGRGLYADTPEHEAFSQHTQCLAALSGALAPDAARDLVAATAADDTLTPATIYFSHYLLEALAQTGHADELSRRLGLWRALPELGFVTPPETPEPSRSDCHGWGSHPLYHLVASVLGVRPAAFGFAEVEVRPNLCDADDGAVDAITRVSAAVPHPRGVVRAELALRSARLTGRIELPDGVSGTLIHGGDERELRPGENQV